MIKKQNNALRRNVQDNIWDSLDGLHFVLEHLPYAVFIVNDKGIIYFTNQSKVGDPSQDLIGTHIIDHITSVDQEVLQDCIRQSFDKGKHSTHLLRSFDKKGQLIIYEITCLPYVDIQGNSLAMIVINDFFHQGDRDTHQKQSEGKFQIVQQFSSNVIWIVDAQLNPIYISPSVESFRGITVAEAMSQTFEETLTPASYAFAKKELQKRLSLEKEEHDTLFQNEPLILEYQRKDGSSVWGESLVSCLRDTNGTVKGFMCITRGITEKKKLDAALKSSEEKYRTLVELSPDGIITLDINGIITSCNKAAEHLFGYSSNKLIGKKISTLTSLDFPPTLRYEHVFQSLLNGDDVPLFEVNSITQDGSTKYIEIYATPIWQDTAVIGFQAHLRDISIRKTIEKDLIKSRETLATFMEEATDAFTIWDKEFRLLDLNQVALQYLPKGTEKEDALGMDFLDFLPAVKEMGTYNRYKQVMNTGRPVFTREMPLDTQAGERRFLSLRVFKVGDGLGIITTDVTDRKKYEETLKREKDTAIRYLNLAGTVIVALDAEGTITLLNKKGYEILGYEEGTLIGKDWFKTCLPKGMVKDVKDVFEKSIKGDIKNVEHFENPVLTKNGEERYISWYNTIIKAKDGTVIGTLSSGEDITERKKAEEKLRESEERFKAFMKHLPVAVFIKDENSRNLYLNEYMRKNLGADDTWIGKTTDEVFPKKLALSMLSNDQKVLSKGYLVKLEEVPNKRGVMRIYQTHKFPIEQKDGSKLLGGFALDVTEQKAMEEALQESEEKYKNLFQQSNDVIFIHDVEGNIVDVNEKGEQLFGYTKQELLSLRIQDLHPSRMLEESNKAFDAVKHHKHITFEIDFRKKNGDIFSAEVSSSLYEMNGRQVIQGIVRNITERKRAQQEVLRTKEQLQNVVNSASEIIIAFDKDARVTMWNRTAEVLTGYKQHKIVGRPVAKISAFEHPEELKKNIDLAYQRRLHSMGNLVLRSEKGLGRVVKPSYTLIKDDTGAVSGILLVGQDITHELEQYGKLMKGCGYLIRDSSSKTAFNLFTHLTKIGYEGLYITRGNPDLIKNKISSLDIHIALFNQRSLGELTTISSLEDLLAAVKNFGQHHSNAVILLDRLDYLITNFSFDMFVQTLYKMSDVLTETNAILLVQVVPALLDQHHLAILEGELQELPSKTINSIHIEDELFEMLFFIYEQNQKNTLVSYTSIGKKFSIVRATTAKKLRILQEKGLIGIKKHGRSKTLHITDRGRELLDKRKVL
jgi:PAS domain S-box-containing protein